MDFVSRFIRISRCNTGPFALLTLLFVAGCGPATAPVKTTTPPPPPTASAENMLRNENYLGAAREFERLYSTTEGGQANRHLMRAVLAYVDAGDPDAAAALLPTEAFGDPVAERLRQLAALSLNRDGADVDPVTQLGEIDSRALTPYQQGFYHRVAARIYASANDSEATLNALLNADRHPIPSASRPAIQRALWRSMANVDERARLRVTDALGQHGRGWHDLYGSATPVLHDSGALGTAITGWRSRYPGHAADGAFVESLFEIAESLAMRPRHIALLLPFEGRYGAASEAIRNGFLAAWYDDQSGSSRPIISVYSVTEQSLLQQHQAAIEAGADLIVGPLQKQNIETLIAYGDLKTPVLALNVIDERLINQLAADTEREFVPEKIYQFGLSPEDEALSVSNRAWRDGIRRVSAIGPNSTFGKRVLSAFIAQWQEMGGDLLAPVYYGDGELRYVNAVRQAFNIDLSDARARQLRADLNRSIVFEPRARRDVEALFLVGFPFDNRQVLPQLKYFGIGNVPIYSTSHTFTGRRDPGSDQDLDGTIFGDMPLIVGTADRTVTATVARGWPGLNSNAKRMFAFGWDAYALSTRLAALRYQPGRTLNGATGLLSMTSEGRVLRDLSFATFVNGVPVSRTRVPY